MMRRGTSLIANAVALVATVALAMPALADGTTLSGSSASLVRGGAPLPSFGSGFSLDTNSVSTPPEAHNNLEIAVTSSDHGVLRFLFSPRVMAGETTNYGFGPTVTGSYVGLAWSIFDSDKLFGSVGLSGSVNRQALDSPVPRLYGPPFALHSSLELGYAFNAQQSLSLSLDHATPTPYAGSDNVRLRYGLHF